MDNHETKIIELPKICDSRGNLSVIENLKQVPFKISGTRWIYGIPGGGMIDEFTNLNQKKLIVALSGSFDVILEKGTEDIYYHLDRAYIGILIPTNTRHRLKNFSTNSIALIVTSEETDEIKLNVSPTL